MRKTSEILRLRWEKGLSIRQIANSVGLSRSTTIWQGRNLPEYPGHYPRA